MKVQVYPRPFGVDESTGLPRPFGINVGQDDGGQMFTQSLEVQFLGWRSFKFLQSGWLLAVSFLGGCCFGINKKGDASLESHLPANLSISLGPLLVFIFEAVIDVFRPFRSSWYGLGVIF